MMVSGLYKGKFSRSNVFKTFFLSANKNLGFSGKELTPHQMQKFGCDQIQSICRQQNKYC